MASSDAAATREWLPAYAIALTAITTIFLVIRAAARLRSVPAARLGYDDFFIVLSWMFSTAITALAIVGTTKYGLDRHLADVPQSQLVTTIEVAWVLNILYLAQTACTKISVLMLYRRISQGIYSPRFKWAVWASIAFVVVYTLVIFILYLTQCIPVDATWKLYDPNYSSDARYYCADASQPVVVDWVAGILAILTDFLTVALPSWILFQIQIAHRAKITLSVVLGLGLLVIIPSAFRLVYLVRSDQPNGDKTWDSFNVTVAGISEGDFGIIFACVPCLGVLFGQFFEDRERDRSSTRHSSHSRSREASRSRQSMRSVHTVHTTPSPVPNPEYLAPATDAPRVLRWHTDSLSDIPEAYADDVGSKPPEERRVDSKTEDYGGRKSVTPNPSRPDTSLSWLNIDMDSSDSDDEAELTGQWYADKYPRTFPHR